MAEAKRVLLLMTPETYRAHDFVAAARRGGVELVVGMDGTSVGAGLSPAGVWNLPFTDPEAATAAIARRHGDRPLSAVVAVDDGATVLAARVGSALGLAANPVESTVSAGHKHVFRQIMAAAGLRSPWYRHVPLDADPARVAAEVDYPCVLKPTFLAASRGVIRADDAAAFVAAFRRISRLLADPEVRARGGAQADGLLVEGFLPGAEAALEGILFQGAFHLLAFFDKPDALDGPFFEETLFITPSRHPEAVQQAAREAVQGAVSALGLRTGPVHAEVRLHQGEAVLLELAPRSIGGHCSRALRFGAGLSLEDLILMQALGTDIRGIDRERRAAGVMMIPIPGAGRLAAVSGREEAVAVAGIDDLELTLPVGHVLTPLPEGNQYLGFIFARGETPAEVEAALREAHGCLGFRVEPEAG